MRQDADSAASKRPMLTLIRGEYREPADPALATHQRVLAAASKVGPAARTVGAPDQYRDSALRELATAEEDYRASVPTTPRGVAVKLLSVVDQLESGLQEGWHAPTPGHVPSLMGMLTVFLRSVCRGLHRGALGPAFDDTDDCPVMVAVGERAAAAEEVQGLIRRCGGKPPNSVAEQVADKYLAAHDAYMEDIPSSTAGMVNKLMLALDMLDDMAGANGPPSRGETTLVLSLVRSVVDGVGRLDEAGTANAGPKLFNKADG